MGNNKKLVVQFRALTFLCHSEGSPKLETSIFFNFIRLVFFEIVKDFALDNLSMR